MTSAGRKSRAGIDWLPDGLKRNILGFKERATTHAWNIDLEPLLIHKSKQTIGEFNSAVESESEQATRDEITKAPKHVLVGSCE